MNRYNFDKEKKFKEENNSSRNSINNNPNQTQHIEEEYEEYVEDNYFIDYLIKGIIIIILFEIFLLSIGVFTTKEINNKPQVVSIEDRKEDVYIEKLNNYLSTLQQNSVRINEIYELYYQNQNRGTREADKELRGYLAENQKIIEDIKYMTTKSVPRRFAKVHEAFKIMVNTRLDTTTSLLSYLRTFSPQHIRAYEQKRDQYHRQINGFSNLWNRLISN